ncbi:hypothetical protein HJB77_29235 [Rhizobium lentis]|uniref:hypothetical protein n=1 Tax=Rhizobium lentis TaxID=1138194 RepID=UPI001C8328F2|nr:hypothetical protein [Rhizobium lentis]MBX5155318.1 hypothetical protein [Rhizobium lentis]MBX5180287.1 hypothetical protein [Rhizobium lentis]
MIDALIMADRLAMMDGGRIRQDRLDLGGTTLTVMRNNATSGQEVIAPNTAITLN